MIRELKYEELLYKEDISGIEEISGETAIGQERAAEALRFGLGVKKKGYNILAVGRQGCGRTALVKKMAEEAAAKEPTPPDICCVYNFREPKNPIMIEFPAGEGKTFKTEISELIHTLGVEIPKAYTAPDYESEKEVLLKEIQSKRDDAVKQISEAAKNLGFSVKSGNGGLTFTPIVDGRAISDDEFDSLSDELKEDFNKKTNIVTDAADGFIKEAREAEAEIKKEIYDIDYNIGLFTAGRFFSPLQEKYKDNKKAAEYIMNLKEDILANMDVFSRTENEEQEDFMSIIPFAPRKNADEVLQKYEVNLFVDNSALEGAPVVVSYNPNYMELVGETRFDNEYGNYTTDFMKIVSGLFHRANGGYLILQLNDILASPFAWDTIKRVLKTGEVVIEPLKDYQFSGISLTALKPEAVGFTGKVIIVCSGYYYEVLRAYDEDTAKLFKVSAFFDYEMDADEDSLKKFVGYLKDFSKENHTLKLDIDAVNRIIMYSKKLSGRKDKLTGVFSHINSLITEADVIAAYEKSPTISADHIKKAWDNAHRRISIYEDKLDEMYARGEMLIDTEGKKKGQINGLSVTEVYGDTFGRPTRITATTYMGKAGLVNIEKESELSGEIHTKGVQVITGYLGNTYAQDFPLCFSGRLCFEQSYGGIDGDSASSAEIYAIVSSLSGVEIRQDLAVTGSVNQFGQIQPIGGVTYKVEGFYDVCKKRGLTGTQGVIIPVQNADELILKDEVLEDIKKGNFKIYAIETIDEGIRLLMEDDPREVHKKVYEKLKGYYLKSKEE